MDYNSFGKQLFSGSAGGAPHPSLGGGGDFFVDGGGAAAAASGSAVATQS